FGTFPVSKDIDIGGNILHNGVTSNTLAAFILVAGDVKPEFYMRTTPDERIQSFDALVTDSDGLLIKEINHTSVRNYLTSIGFKIDPNDPNSIIEYRHTLVRIGTTGSAYTLGIIQFTPEGYIVVASHVPTGSNISFTTVDDKGIIETAADLISKSTQDPNKTLICYSCMLRRLTIIDAFAEIEVVLNQAGSSNYHFSYSGGEICPVMSEEGIYVNKYHNLTLIACLL
ncbi:MAG: FIST C-terminal domain-containing protein, partial [Christensenellaceae bacterium]|nr:FIST C-terminal domain-containing protein [Christensenellaceae bacterium]